MYYIVSYDIEDDKRRNRVAKALKDFGQRVQYSVFECETDLRNYFRLKDRLEKLIDSETDSVIFYHLCQSCESRMERLGLNKKPFDKGQYIV